MGATKYLYTIDGLGRRIARSHQPAAGGAITVDEEYVYLDQTRIGAVLDGSGGLVWRFIYVTGRHTPDYAVDASGTLFRLVTDQLGSVRLVVNATSGVIVQRTDYDAWGNATDVSLPTHPIPLGFAGGLYDRSTKLVHFGVREYDPEVGAWTSKDPIGFKGGPNVFGYVNDDPVNSWDVEGLRVFRCHDVPDLPGSSILDAIGMSHEWLQTDSLAGGLGPSGAPGGILGIGAPVYVSNEEGRSLEEGAQCDELDESEYSEQCIDSKLVYGDDLGLWLPWNSCVTFVSKTLAACRRPD